MSFLGAMVRQASKLRKASTGARNATRGAVRSGRAAERELRRTQNSVQGQIDKSLAGLDKAGSAATISGALGRAGAYGGVAAAGMGFASGIKEKFGHQMSGAANFGIGAVGVGLGLGAGLAGVTQLGRAGIMAHGRYGANLGGTADKLRSGLVKSHRTARNSRRNIASARKTQLSKGADLDKTVYRSQRMSGHAQHRTMNRMTNTVDDGFSGGLGFRGTEAEITAGRNLRRETNRARRTRAELAEGTTVSNRAKNTSANIKEAMGDSKTVFKNLKANKQKLDKFDAYNRAQKFSARKIAGTIGKLPFTMGGAMLGKGSGLLGGIVDPAMKFIGPAMAMGTWSGLAAGTGVGIAAVKSGNLGRTQGAAQRPQGRSFSNISYNATLHAHRISK